MDIMWSCFTTHQKSSSKQPSQPVTPCCWWFCWRPFIFCFCGIRSTQRSPVPVIPTSAIGAATTENSGQFTQSHFGAFSTLWCCWFWNSSMAYETKSTTEKSAWLAMASWSFSWPCVCLFWWNNTSLWCFNPMMCISTMFKQRTKHQPKLPATNFNPIGKNGIAKESKPGINTRNLIASVFNQCWN